jgi:hypothetical protein
MYGLETTLLAAIDRLETGCTNAVDEVVIAPTLIALDCLD